MPFSMHRRSSPSFGSLSHGIRIRSMQGRRCISAAVGPKLRRLSKLTLHGIAGSNVGEVRKLIGHLARDADLLREVDFGYDPGIVGNDDANRNANFLGRENSDFLSETCKFTSFCVLGFTMNHETATEFVDRLVQCPELTALGLQHLVILDSENLTSIQIEARVCALGTSHSTMGNEAIWEVPARLAQSRLCDQLDSLHIGMERLPMVRLREAGAEGETVEWPRLNKVWLCYSLFNTPREANHIEVLKAFPNVKMLSISGWPLDPNDFRDPADREWAGYLSYSRIAWANGDEVATDHVLWDELMGLLPGLQALTVGISMNK